MQVESLFESGVIKMLNTLARVYKEQDLNDQQQQHHHPQVYICVFILLYSRSIHISSYCYICGSSSSSTLFRGAACLEAGERLAPVSVCRELQGLQVTYADEC